MSAKPTPSRMMVASCTEGDRNETRLAYSRETEIPNSGLYTAIVMGPERRCRSQELWVRLEPTSILHPRVMFFPSTAFTLSGTITWLALAPADRERDRKELRRRNGGQRPNPELEFGGARVTSEVVLW